MSYADIVLTGGKVATVDKNFSICEAAAIRGDKIIFVGTNTEARSLIGPKTLTLNLEGHLILPGLIDAHTHFLLFAEAHLNIDLNNVPSFEEVVSMVKKKARKIHPGEWILGRGWDHNIWLDRSFPDHEALTRAAPDNPVFLMRKCEHAAVVNKKAMEVIGISADSPDPPGGRLQRRPNGELTGVLLDEAYLLVRRKLPPLTKDRLMQALLDASKNCLSVGLTGIHEAGTSPSLIQIYKKLADDDNLGLRLYAMLEDPGTRDTEEYLRENRLIGYARQYLTINSIKLFTDGALASRGAALFEPYSDDPENTGTIISSPEHIFHSASAALRAGMQINTHAIGDRAIHQTLNSYEKALQKNPDPNHRFRIEHAQIISRTDLPRFVQLGIIPSMQPCHAVSDMAWTEQRVGKERVQGAYAIQNFIQAGAAVPCGSDFPIESNNPLLGIYKAVTRKDEEGNPPDGWMPDQVLSIKQAIRGYTHWAAFAAFQEDFLGSIEEGKLADMTILDRDILTSPPQEILSTRIAYTITGGKIRYSKES